MCISLHLFLSNIIFLLNNVLLLILISLLFTEIDSKTIKEWCNGLKNHKFTTSSPPNLRITQAGTRIRLHPLRCDENSRQMTQIHSLGFWMRKKISSFLRWLEEEQGGFSVCLWRSWLFEWKNVQMWHCLGCGWWSIVFLSSKAVRYPSRKFMKQLGTPLV